MCAGRPAACFDLGRSLQLTGFCCASLAAWAPAQTCPFVPYKPVLQVRNTKTAGTSISVAMGMKENPYVCQ